MQERKGRSGRSPVPENRRASLRSCTLKLIANLGERPNSAWKLLASDPVSIDAKCQTLGNYWSCPIDISMYFSSCCRIPWSQVQSLSTDQAFILNCDLYQFEQLTKHDKVPQSAETPSQLVLWNPSRNAKMSTCLILLKLIINKRRQNRRFILRRWMPEGKHLSDCV